MIVGGTSRQKRRFNYSPITMPIATAPAAAGGAGGAVISLPIPDVPQVIPSRGDPMGSSGLYPSWVKSGGTLLPYTATTHIPGFLQPILGPPLLHRMTPFTPLLMLGFGLNMLLFASEQLSPREDPKWDAV